MIPVAYEVLSRTYKSAVTVGTVRNAIIWIAAIVGYFIIFQLFYNMIAFKQIFPYTDLLDMLTGFVTNFIPILVTFLSIYGVIFCRRTKATGWRKIWVDGIFALLLVVACNLAYMGVNILYDDHTPYVDWAGTVFNGIFIFLGIDVVYYVRNFRKVLIATEDERRKKLMYKYDALKAQINPHFMFNTLSMLHALLYIDVSKARHCVTSLSEMYRYVVSHEGSTSVPISDELEFLRTFVDILESRYEGLKVDISDCVEQTRGRLMIPFTLQLLMENVVKHNNVSVTEPLRVTVRFDNNVLVMRNTISPRTACIHSTGIGLRYITDMYALHNRHVEVNKSNTFFEVRIPFL